MRVHFKKVTIIGIGLIGGSLALAMKKRQLATTIVGVDQDVDQLEQAVARGAIDASTRDCTEGVKGADLVVLATPVGSFNSIIRQVTTSLTPGCLITDVGSTKRLVVSQIEQVLPETVFWVGGHPIAGREKSGVAASSADLFKGARCILTPTSRTHPEALERIKQVWKELGSDVMTMGPDEHDRVFAAVSHFPHMAAYALVNTAMDLLDGNRDLLSISGGGFKDFSRIAASSPEMWRDICLHNGDNILTALEAYQATLNRIQQYIKDQKAVELQQEFARAKRLREEMN